MNSSVKAAERTLDLFEAFGAEPEPLTLTQVARRIRTPLSSCHALVRTLEARGYLYVLGGPQRLYPTRRLLDVARSITRHDPILEFAEPHLERLRDETRETVILGKRDGDAVLYLGVWEGPQTIRYSARAGERKPLHSSAIGKALLAGLDAASLRETLAQAGLPRVTSATIVDVDALARDLDAGRRRGFQRTRGENVADVLAVAGTVAVAKETLGLAVAGPLSRMEAAQAECAAALARCVAAIEEATR